MGVATTMIANFAAQHRQRHIQILILAMVQQALPTPNGGVCYGEVQSIQPVGGAFGRMGPYQAKLSGHAPHKAGEKL